MRNKGFLFFLLILASLLISGCLREYANVEITSIDVMPSRQDEGTKLAITPYIQNNQERDTGILTVKAKIREFSTNLIVAEKDADIGYIKSKSTSASSITLVVANPGDYMVEVQLYENGKLLTQNNVPVTVKPKPDSTQPAEIKLTDMNLKITKLYNDATVAVVEVSPGIYNEGGDSKPLTMEVTARTDQYTADIKLDEFGSVKSMNYARGKVTFDIPRNKEYSFTVTVKENGKTMVTGRVSEKIKLNEIKYNEPRTYVFVEEGKPIEKAPAAGKKTEPGFESAVAMIGLLLVYFVLVRVRR
ncbi:Uncharacterised protein [uncultured archaeon]|nr:Uncharacterised protein [uncultured archaeon]